MPGARVRSAEGKVLTAPNVNTVNTFDKPDAVAPKPIRGTVRNGTVMVTVPAKSVSMIALGE